MKFLKLHDNHHHYYYVQDFMTQYKPNTVAINLSGGIASKSVAALVEKELVREVHQILVTKRADEKLAKRKKMMMNDDDGYNESEVFDDGDDNGDDGPYTANVIFMFEKYYCEYYLTCLSSHLKFSIKVVHVLMRLKQF